MRWSARSTTSHFENPELADISNVLGDGSVAPRDHAKMVANVARSALAQRQSVQRPRAKYSMLSAHVVPGFGGRPNSPTCVRPTMRCRTGASVERGLSARHYALHLAIHAGRRQGCTPPSSATAIAPAVLAIVHDQPALAARSCTSAATPARSSA